MLQSSDVVAHLRAEFPDAITAVQTTRDGIATIWLRPDKVIDVLRHLKSEIEQPYRMLYDLTAIDERTRGHHENPAAGAFSVVYHLLSFERNADIRIKVSLPGNHPTIDTITPLWPSANWYEREVWDMFGITFSGHPHLRRILLPPTWQGHPLQKQHPARATEMEPFSLPDEKYDAEQEADQFRPEDWGLTRKSADSDFMFLNLGPHHPGTHGLLRLVLQLDGEEIINRCRAGDWLSPPGR